MSIRSAEVELSGQGLVLVQGKNNDDPAFDSNGAGKSSVFELLVWILFDKTVRGLSGDEVVNRNIGKNCVGFLDFVDDSDNSTYRIARYRKHSEHKNNAYIFKNGTNITPKSTKDANKMIETIFQIDYTSFTNSILFGQGLVKMFSVATDKEKKEILEKMLQMEDIKKCLDIAKKRLSEKNEELSRNETTANRIENLISEIETTIKSLQTAEKEQAEKTQREIEELTEELQEAEKELEQFKVTTDSDRLEALELIKAKLDKKVKSFKQYEDAKFNIQSEISSLKSQAKRIVKESEKLVEEAEEIASGVNKTCPTCGQSIADTKEAIEEALGHIVKKRKELRKERKELEEKVTELQEDFEKIEEVLSKKDAYVEKLDEVKGEISQITASVRAEENLRKSLHNNVTRIKSSIERLEKEKGKTYEALINQKEEQLTEQQKALKELQSQKGSLAVEVEMLKFWVDGFGNTGIKSYLLDSVTPFLNKRANHYLSKLAGSTMMVEFSTQTRLASGELRDKFEIRLLNSVGGDSYTSNSEGEKRRIDLAISLALQDLVRSRSNGRLNILLYDEIFDSLDSVGSENAITLLNEMQNEVETIFVITHNDILKSYFDRYLIVTKEDGATRVHKEG